jgi:hypothetical protein
MLFLLALECLHKLF